MRRLIDSARRQLEERIDQLAAVLKWQFTRSGHIPPMSSGVKIALITANFSTTHWLTLMLLTLSRQSALASVSDIVVVDNDSRDGGPDMLRELARLNPRITFVQNRWRLSHARAIRKGIRTLDQINSRANVILAIDTDVIFLREDCLADLAAVFAQGAALAGEMRHDLFETPEAQASFLAFRRDVCFQPGIRPWVNHGSPSYWMQRSIRQAGLSVSDFRTYDAAYALHRGRSGVQASHAFYPTSSYASVENNQPHFMGNVRGPEIWHQAEQQWASRTANPDPIVLAQTISNALQHHD